jgi:transcriptional regulator GlxA family with amidase domain
MDLVPALPRRLRQRAVPTRTDVLTRVDIALFNGFALPKVAAIIEIFQRANSLNAARQSGRARYDVSLLSAAGGRIASSSSVFVWTDDVESHEGTNDSHLLFIAGGTGVPQACRDERLSNWLRRRHSFSEVVHPIAEGILLLQAAGLRSRYCPLYYEDLEMDGLFPPRVLREAPTAMQAALRIVEVDLGPELARQISNSIAPHHKAAISPEAELSAPSHVSEKILASARWLEANVDRPISIDDAAQVAAMSERNFLRRFKSEIGMTPSDYLLRARLDMSCRMLIESHLPVDRIARRCGIGSGGQLSRLFRKYLAMTPTDYRTRKDVSKNATYATPNGGAIVSEPQ